MVTTLPPPPKRRPSPSSVQAAYTQAHAGPSQRHGLKPQPSNPPMDLPNSHQEPETLSGTLPPLKALKIAPAAWTTTTPNLTLPLLLLAVLAWVGFGAMGLLAAPLPNWSSGLLAIWQEAGNVTAPSYAHVWDAVWYRPQLPWAMACGAFLGPWPAMMAAALWLGLSLLGLPLMASGGGLGLLGSPVFGFALGLIATAGVAGWLTNAPNPALLEEIDVRNAKKPLLVSLAKNDDSLTLLQRAQVPSLVALRRQKKLNEKLNEKLSTRRQQQFAANPTALAYGGGFRSWLRSVFLGYKLSIKVLTRLQRGLFSLVTSLRPTFEASTPFNKAHAKAYAKALWVGRLCGVSVLSTAAAHALGWIFLGVLSLYYGWSSIVSGATTFSAIDFSTAQGYLTHWSGQLSLLSWGYDALFGLCGLMLAQGLRRMLGIVLFD